MNQKSEYLKNLIQKIKKHELKNIDDEINNIKQKMFDKKYSFETNHESDLITPSILSELDELNQQIIKNQYITGSYYTPKALIRKIINEIDFKNKKIIDPSGGAGNFLIFILLEMGDDFKNKEAFVQYISDYIYINEIKESSLNIYIDRINLLSLKLFNHPLSKGEINLIKKNCFNFDFLIDFNFDIKFDIIIGNPPYLGTKSMGRDYLNKIKKEFGFTDDLYSLFLFKSIKHLNETGFLSFITSSTYLTISSKQHLRDFLIDNGIYKIIKNNSKHFNIKTQTATIFINKNKNTNVIEIFNEDDRGENIHQGVIQKNKGIRFNTFKNKYDEQFSLTESIYNEFKNKISTTKSFEKFIKSDEFFQLINNNDYLPLGLIAYIATGVDFKGNNSTTLYSLNNKFNQIYDHNLIEYKPTKNDFINGLLAKKYIPAIKGKDKVFVLWNEEHVNYLKEIKAPLRNIRLYGEKDKIYCKTSSFDFIKVDKYTLCINTAGACFVMPIIDISLDDILNQINQLDIKTYIKENINNSLCITPNDLKIIPIKIR